MMSLKKEEDGEYYSKVNSCEWNSICRIFLATHIQICAIVCFQAVGVGRSVRTIYCHPSEHILFLLQVIFHCEYKEDNSGKFISLILNKLSHFTSDVIVEYILCVCTWPLSLILIKIHSSRDHIWAS